jgi:ribosomal protein S12 methylthiotransferase accessory factor
MEYMATFINLITSNKIIGQPYKNLANPDETIYYDPRLNGRLCGSIGMAAGNTQEEALNQGLSEVCEHIVQNGFYSYPMDKYYRLDLSKLNNPELLKMINNIHKAGSKIYLYDLSYNFNMPVFMSIIINKNTKRSYVNFGSFPVADIAIERVITENY